MANRARSTIRALHLLGNSIRGLDLINWRRVFHAIILPILTYGVPLWGRLPHNTSLKKLAQVAQNDALRRMAGVFKTTPIEPLHHLTAVLPFSYTLDKLCNSFSDRLARLPPSHHLRSLTTHHQAAAWSSNNQALTSLTRLLPPSFAIFHLPALRGHSDWTHARLLPHFIHPPSPEFRAYTRDVIRTQSHLHLYVQLIPFENAFVAISLLFLNGQLVEQARHRGHDGPEAMLLALVQGMRSALRTVTGDDGNTHLFIFLPNRSLSMYLLSLRKHRYLHYSSTFTSLCSDFLGSDDPCTIRLFWYSTNWSGLPGSGLIEEAAVTQPPLSPSSQPSLASRRDQAFHNWRHDYMNTPRQRHHANVSITPPNDNHPPPFVRGLMKSKNRRLVCAGLQLTNRHCFDANYSHKFRPNSGDETTCPCSFSNPPDPRRVELSAHREVVVRLGSPSPSSPSPLSPSLSPPDGFTLSIAHTVEHVLLECPLTASLRDSHLHHSGLHFIFGTEAGGVALTRFLHFSQLLQRPLPPRPDPP